MSKYVAWIRVEHNHKSSGAQYIGNDTNFHPYSLVSCLSDNIRRFNTKEEAQEAINKYCEGARKFLKEKLGWHSGRAYDTTIERNWHIEEEMN